MPGAWVLLPKRTGGAACCAHCQERNNEDADDPHAHPRHRVADERSVPKSVRIRTTFSIRVEVASAPSRGAAGRIDGDAARGQQHVVVFGRQRL